MKSRKTRRRSRVQSIDAPVPIHEHRFRLSGTSPRSIKNGGPVVHSVCSADGCAMRHERVAKGAEARKILKEHRDMWREVVEMHAVYNKFRHRFWSGPAWKYRGYKFMQKARNYVARNPKDIYMCQIDDALNSSSEIVFIAHRSRKVFHGTTVIVIPQNSGPPCEYFMYPCNVRDVLSVMKKLDKMGRKSPY